MEADGGLEGRDVAEAASGLLHPDHGIRWREAIHWCAYAEQRGTCRLTAEGGDRGNRATPRDCSDEPGSVKLVHRHTAPDPTVHRTVCR